MATSTSDEPSPHPEPETAPPRRRLSDQPRNDLSPPRQGGGRHRAPGPQRDFTQQVGDLLHIVPRLTRIAAEIEKQWAPINEWFHHSATGAAHQLGEIVNALLGLFQ